jgi:hypothetical protein
MNEKNSNSSLLKIIILAIAIVIVAALSYVFFNQPKFENNVPKNSLSQNLNTVQSLAISSSQISTSSTSAASVTWQEPVEIKDLKLTDLPLIDENSGYAARYYNQFDDVHYYKVGTVNNSKVSGDIILMTAVNTVYGEMYSEREKYFFVQSPQKIVLLQNHSSAIDTSPFHTVDGQKVKTGGFTLSKFTVDSTIILDELMLPKKITFTNPRQIIQKRNEVVFSQFPELKNSLTKSELPYSQGIVLISTSTGLFYITNKTPVVGEYEYVPDFFDTKTGVPQFTLNNGQKNTQAYKYTQEDCHKTDLLAVVDTIRLSKDMLVEVGKNSYGDSVYEIKKQDHEFLKSTFQSLSSMAQNNESFETFIKNKPLLFWVDPFGRMVQLKNAKYYELPGCD